MTDQTHADALDELARVRAQREPDYFDVAVDITRAHAELMLFVPQFGPVSAEVFDALTRSNVRYMRGEHDRSL